MRRATTLSVTEKANKHVVEPLLGLGARDLLCLDIGSIYLACDIGDLGVSHARFFRLFSTQFCLCNAVGFVSFTNLAGILGQEPCERLTKRMLGVSLAVLDWIFNRSWRTEQSLVHGSVDISREVVEETQTKHAKVYIVHGVAVFNPRISVGGAHVG